MDIKEIALNVAQATNLHYIVTSEKHTNDDWNIRFATALLAEIQKQNEPVGSLVDGKWQWNTNGGPEAWRKRREYSGNLFAFPPSVEAIENRVAEPEYFYAYRRKGLSHFCTCDKEIYDELSGRPRLFEMAVFIKHMKGD